MSTRGTARRRAKARARRWSYRFSWLSGAFLVCLGALSGAFGTIAWLTALCAPSLGRLLLGMISFGLVPVVSGGAMLWAGLGILEKQAARSRVRDLPESQIVDATRGGAGARTIAERLGATDVDEMTRRLDEMVAREVLALDISDDGELLYRRSDVG